MNESPLTAYLLALLVGGVAGLRTLTAPASVSWASHLGRLHLGDTWLAFLGYTWTPWILTAARDRRIHRRSASVHAQPYRAPWVRRPHRHRSALRRRGWHSRRHDDRRIGRGYRRRRDWHARRARLSGPAGRRIRTRSPGRLHRGRDRARRGAGDCDSAAISKVGHEVKGDRRKK